MREITCINNTGNISQVFNDTFSPFLLQDVEGIYMFDVNVFSSDNTLSDGATIIGHMVKPRNIVITLADRESHPDHRNFLYSLFKPKTNGTFIYHEIDDDYVIKRCIDYVVEKVQAETMGHTRQITISLLCPDPFFSDLEETTIYMSTWLKNFEFIHEFVDEKEEFGSQSIQKMIQIQNDSSLDNLGVVITMEAQGVVVNPKMYHFETDSYIQVGTTANPLTLHIGDKVIISTVTNEKNVYLISDGEKTTINEYIDEDSEYIQLTSGENTLRYSASSGEDNLHVKISYKQKYQGV